MSVQWITWVLGGRVGGQKIEPLRGPKNGQRLVLLALANHATDDGRAWPSKETLASETNLTKTAVDRAVNWLQGNGYIERSVNGAGKELAQRATRSPNLYRLLGDVESNPPDFGSLPKLHQPASRNSGGRTPLISGAEPSVEPSVEPSPVVESPTAPSPGEVDAFGWTIRKGGHARADAIVASFAASFGLVRAEQSASFVRGIASQVNGLPKETTAEDVPLKVAAYRRQHPTWECTIAAVVKHWGSLKTTNTNSTAAELRTIDQHIHAGVESWLGNNPEPDEDDVEDWVSWNAELQRLKTHLFNEGKKMKAKGQLR